MNMCMHFNADLHGIWDFDTQGVFSLLYFFQVTVPSKLIALMSAIKDDEEALKEDTRTCKFHQKVSN